ncbi:hypothetical protein [Poseidonibacter lekithochrous]|uniref:hypothetical protein n=1 Tax=Poseidonibacter lekithochrous TaxID=1904463 RepID=UPI0008FCBBA0|nr:hypothetical protein [Poseidonibacter lekithochrous]QKJ23404.1 putative membrane protein [Poseidonibacter lekithochrous]
MTERNNLENPLFLFTFLLIAIILNTIASIHFLLIMLSGILFIAFYICLKKKYLYSLFFVILTFLFIEVNSGFKPLSLSLLSLFLYIFVLPKISRTVSFSSLNNYLYIIIFYIGVTIIWSLSTDINETVAKAIVLNILIDLIFLGTLL